MSDSTTATIPAELEQGFQELRPELVGYSYRMLGSPFEAEDAVQETFIRAWRAYDGFEGRASLRSWLYRITTNVCLDMLGGRERRARPMDLGPAQEPIEANLNTMPEATWIQPAPDPADLAESNETTRLAIIAALQHLPPRQRAVLILCEVLRWRASEVAELLETSVASVNSALQRARKTVDEKLPDESQQEALRNLDDAELRELVENYSAALEEGDIDQILALLTEDATWSMPPLVNWYRGKEAVRGFLELGPAPLRWRHIPTHANGQAAVGCYMWDEDSGKYLSFCIDVLTLRGGKIAAVTAFIDRDVFPRFGLPDEYPA